MNDQALDQTHKIEVRMYSRDIAGFTELFFVDHEGNERVVAQWRGAPPFQLTAEISHQEQPPIELEEREIPDPIPNGPPLPPTEASPGWFSRLVGGVHEEDTPTPPETWTPPAPAPGAPATPPMFGPELPEVPLDDTARRRAAKAHIRTLTAQLSRNSHDQQMRYELALQARNKNVRALEMFEPEAVAMGAKVADLVERVITDRHARERRMMQVYAIQARVLRELDQAAGEQIARLEKRGADEINGVDEQ